MNNLVIWTNGNKMPVYGDRLYGNNSATHFLFSDFKQINFPYFADIIDFQSQIIDFHISIGDILIFISLFYLSCFFGNTLGNYIDKIIENKNAV